MKKVTSATIFNDAVGTRISFTYAEIDEKSGEITRDNIRLDKIITEKDILSDAGALLDYCQEYVDKEA